MAFPTTAGISIAQSGETALLKTPAGEHRFAGRWVVGDRWERFGLYDQWVVIRADGAARAIPAHSGEIVPGATEDLVDYLHAQMGFWTEPTAPFTLELDPTYSCASKDCGSRCFSAAYRRLDPTASIPKVAIEAAIEDFAQAGGRVLRFDGGGDPLSHPAVRDGSLPQLGHRWGLRTTILTSGDLLARTNVEALAGAECYVRVSVNASTEETRRRFHGNSVSLKSIFEAIRGLKDALYRQGGNTPIGATFLLDQSNYPEVAACAAMCREQGISHFSVRRVLGPASLRPVFSESESHETAELLDRVRAMNSDAFRTFVPWRDLSEPDLSPFKGDIDAQQCWQSTFKTVMEPNTDKGSDYRLQLCGRYRGGGIGQLGQLPSLIQARPAEGWTAAWRATFREYPISRTELVHRCESCIDRGFIQMMDQLMEFLGPHRGGFQILHLAGKPR